MLNQQIDLSKETDAMASGEYQLPDAEWKMFTVDTGFSYGNVWEGSMFSIDSAAVNAAIVPFEVLDSLGVKAHLYNNPILSGFLDEAAHRIRAIFGDAHLVLGMLPSSVDDGAPCLAIKIKPGQAITRIEALRNLDALDEEWWLDRPASIDGKLMITLG